jgi:long-chain acyl-CoA synthetase
MTRKTATGLPPAPVDPTHNLTTRVFEFAESTPTTVVVRHNVDGRWRSVTASQLAERVRGIAAGLVAVGIQPGDRVALMSSTRYEWTLADLGILAAGAVTVPIYETSSVSQCEWILSDSGAKAAVAGGESHAKTLEAARSAAPDLGEIAVIDDGGLEGLAERASESDLAAVDLRRSAVTLTDLASLIYTSGTTGNPKGCELTHGNLLYAARQTDVYLSELFGRGDSTLLFLPLAHVFARIIQFGCLDNAVVLGYARSVETLVEDLQTFHPTFLLSVPRVFEKVFNTAQRKATGAKAKIFDFAVATGREWSSSASPNPLTKAKKAVADALVYSKFRAALGGQVRYCVSGGAPLSPHLAHFFHAAGITILEGYGLTETSAASSCNTVRDMKIGSVGKPAPGVEFRVGEDGELHIKGPTVFRGYWHNEAATAEAIEPDGWFHTGDLGTIDDDGFVFITGRKKEIIVTSAGKNVAPAVLEEGLKAHRLVSQAMVVGDQRPFVGALVTLEPDELAAFAKEHSLTGGAAELHEHPAIRAEVDKAVAAANERVSKAESIRSYRILPRDFDAEHDEMTPSMKLRRNRIVEHFQDEIEKIYAPR